MTKLLRTLLMTTLFISGAKSFAQDLPPLVKAASEGDKKAVETLLKKGSSVNEKSSYNNSALHTAIANDHTEVAKILINKGASLENIGEDQESALFVATTTNNAALMKLILKKQKSLLNTPDNEGTTPLMEAAKYGTKETIEVLLKAGAKKDLKNKQGQTALDIAQENKNEDAIKLLGKK